MDIVGKVTSPNGRIECEVALRKGVAYYRVARDGEMVISWSRLGFAVMGGILGRHLTLVTSFTREKNELWETEWGEERMIRNNYRELELNFREDKMERVVAGGVGLETTEVLEERTGQNYDFTILVRVFDEGVAFRYEINQTGNDGEKDSKWRNLRTLDELAAASDLVILGELTEFNVPTETKAWWIPAYQPDRYEYNYIHSGIDRLGDLSLAEQGPAGLDYTLDGAAHTPLTLELVDGGYMAIHEAALYDYGSMTVRRGDAEEGAMEVSDGERVQSWQTLKADITPLSNGVRAYAKLPFVTPWRIIMLADDQLSLTQNRMMLNLNDPPQGDFGWVKPLMFMGIWWALYVKDWTWAPGTKHGATTEHMKYYIDVCKWLRLGGVLAEGWNNGWDGDWLENGVHSDFLTPQGDYDLPYLAKYAKEQGVELVMHHETVGFIDNYERQLEAAYQYCAENGIHYVKSGYANSRMTTDGHKEFHHSQIGVRHYQRAAEMAAKHQICLDVHEPIKGTGIERTWPNLLTREGARGQEYESGALHPSHATILPFTRMLAGGMDYTSGILDVNNDIRYMKTTIIRQLAYFVTIFSGMQMAADRAQVYEEWYPDLAKFISKVPVNWERTTPLMGEIGKYYVVARQARVNTGVDGVRGDVDDIGMRANMWRGDGVDDIWESAEDLELERAKDGDWYVGGVCGEEAKIVEVCLDFLDEGDYVAEIYRDGEEANCWMGTRDRYVIEERIVRKGDRLAIWMGIGGGFVVRIHR